MKNNCIHVVFVVDESGSMYSSVNDVIGGFNKVVDEQRAVADGTCLVSYFKFATDVHEVYRLKDVHDVEHLSDSNYSPNGLTAMNDGIGFAIDTVGKCLAEMDESERPEKNLVVVITDGEENNSKDYTIEKVKEMIKHQEEVYNWSFIYLGTNINDVSYASHLGFSASAANTRASMGDTYSYISHLNTAYRSTDGDMTVKCMAFCDAMVSGATALNEQYEAETGQKVTGVANAQDYENSAVTATKADDAD